MISSLLLEAAFRSVLLALAVWAGLRIFGVRNVLAQKAAWGLVLVSALGMPILLPYAAHWSVLPANVRVALYRTTPRLFWKNCRRASRPRLNRSRCQKPFLLLR